VLVSKCCCINQLRCHKYETGWKASRWVVTLLPTVQTLPTIEASCNIRITTWAGIENPTRFCHLWAVISRRTDGAFFFSRRHLSRVCGMPFGLIVNPQALERIGPRSLHRFGGGQSSRGCEDEARQPKKKKIDHTVLTNHGTPYLPSFCLSSSMLQRATAQGHLASTLRCSANGSSEAVQAANECSHVKQVTLSFLLAVGSK